MLSGVAKSGLSPSKPAIRNFKDISKKMPHGKAVLRAAFHSNTFKKTYRLCGSSFCWTQSPRSDMESVEITMTTPGMTAIHQAVVR